MEISSELNDGFTEGSEFDFFDENLPPVKNEPLSECLVAVPTPAQQKTNTND